jgi:3-methyladenine DNA glycosylase AlkC
MPAGDQAKPARKGSPSRAAIPPDVLQALNEGRLESATLAEALAVDQEKLIARVAPHIPAERIAGLNGMGVAKRMSAAAFLLLGHSVSLYVDLLEHPSDTVRGWACFWIGLLPESTLFQRLELIRPLAADPHFGVREWAWLAVRPHIACELERALRLLEPWTHERDAALRRFASEATRPRGVWCAHLPQLKRDPALALRLLEPLKGDPVRYVQDSVGNWLNDAAKDNPDWVRDLCARWRRESPLPSTERIIGRALRSL